VFLTGTAAEITPVGQIDNYKFTPATITHTLMGDFEKATRG
jgi:branched-chain amino acid aminotransferase